jgi:hypothetical protein
VGYLRHFGEYLNQVGSRIIVAESHGETDNALGVRRAAAVMETLIVSQRLDRDRFSVAVNTIAPSDSYGGRAFTEITLLNIGISK